MCLLALAAVAGGCAKFSEAESLPEDGGGPSADGPAEGSARCNVDTCDGRGASCRTYDFTVPPCPPPDWSFSGDENNPGAVHECTPQGLRLAARDTLDVTGEVGLRFPTVLDVARVSLRFSANSWDGRQLFHVGGSVGAGSESDAFIVTATETARGEMMLALCVGDPYDLPVSCVPWTTTTFGTEHVMAIELTSAGAEARLDCGPAVRHAGRGIKGGAGFRLAFGHPEGTPFDGILGMATLSFR